jgi:signal transduction histidine kinase
VVDDGGPGIPEDKREAVFGRFSRLGKARQVYRAGLGLGLALTREVARRHGCDCILGDAPGGGCRVVISLPALA